MLGIAEQRFGMRRSDITGHLVVTLVVIICAMVLMVARPSLEPVGAATLSSIVSYWFGRYQGAGRPKDGE